MEIFLPIFKAGIKTLNDNKKGCPISAGPHGGKHQAQAGAPPEPPPPTLGLECVGSSHQQCYRLPAPGAETQEGQGCWTQASGGLWEAREEDEASAFRAGMETDTHTTCLVWETRPGQLVRTQVFCEQRPRPLPH